MFEKFCVQNRDTAALNSSDIEPRITLEKCPLDAQYALRESSDGVLPRNDTVRNRTAIALLVTNFDQGRIEHELRAVNRVKDNDQADIIFLLSDFPLNDFVPWAAERTNRKIRYISVGQYWYQFPSGFNPSRETPTWTKRSAWGYHRMIQSGSGMSLGTHA